MDGQQIWQWFVDRVLSNPVSLIALALAIFFYFKNRRFKRLSYAQRSKSLVHDYRSKVPKLELSYEGQPIENLIISRAVIWNSGKETISETDIPPADKLTLTLPNGTKILAYEIRSQLKPANEIGLSKDILSGVGSQCERVIPSFNFLDPHDGFVCDILHTGSPYSISFAGSIKGGTILRGVAAEPEPPPHVDDIIAMIACAAWIVISAHEVVTSYQGGTITRGLAFGGMGILSIGALAFKLWIHFYDFPRALNSYWDPL